MHKAIGKISANSFPVYKMMEMAGDLLISFLSERTELVIPTRTWEKRLIFETIFEYFDLYGSAETVPVKATKQIVAITKNLKISSFKNITHRTSRNLLNSINPIQHI